MSDTVTKILRPASVGTNPGSFAANTGTLWDATDPGDPIFHDDATTYAGRGSGGAVDFSMSPDTTFNEVMVAVTEVIQFLRLQWQSVGSTQFQSKVFLSASSSTSGDHTMNTTYNNFDYNVTAVRPGGGDWTEADFRDATYQFGLSIAGAVRITSMWTRVTYVPGSLFIEAYKDVWSRRLRRSRFPEEVYQVKVPLEFLALELLDEMNLSDQSLPRAASLIADLSRDGTIKEWQRLYALNVEQRVNLNDMTMVLSASDLEPYMCIFWSTGKAPFTVSDDTDGVACTNSGAVLTFTRASSAWISQADGQVVALTEGHEKANHVGTTLDEARTNLITNSNFQAGVAEDWTTVTGGGAGAAANDTSTLLFANSTAYPNSVKITRGSSETYIHQSFTAPGDNGFRTIAIDHRNESTGLSSWWLQRSADGLWWDDDGEDWQSARYENAMGTYDAANIVNQRSVSNPIIEATGSDTWLLQVGIGSDTALENDVAYIFQVDCVEGSYIVERIVTGDSTTLTTQADTMKWTLNLGTGSAARQTWPVDRGTIRCTYTPGNSVGHVQTDDELVLLLGQLGDEATSPTDYDVLLYQNLSGSNPRFSFERYIGGALAARATKDHNIIRDTPVEIAVRMTSQTNEFDLIPGGTTSRDLDGSNDYYVFGANPTGLIDSKRFYISFWIRVDGGDGTARTIMENSGQWFEVILNTSNEVQILGWTSGPTKVLDINSSAIAAGSGWHHIAVSVRLGTTTCYLYLDGAEDKTETTCDDGTIDFTRADWSVGGRIDGTQLFPGAVSEMIFQDNKNQDLSDAVSLARLIDSNGDPTDLGSDGSKFAGVIPLMYFPDGDCTHNRGSGGNFTAQGSPTSDGGPATSAIEIYVDGAAGETRGLSVQHDSDELDSEFWIGSAPAGLGYLRALGALSNIELVQRVMPAEEISARR